MNNVYRSKVSVRELDEVSRETISSFLLMYGMYSNTTEEFKQAVGYISRTYNFSISSLLNLAAEILDYKDWSNLLSECEKLSKGKRDEFFKACCFAAGDQLGLRQTVESLSAEVQKACDGMSMTDLEKFKLMCEHLLFTMEKAIKAKPLILRETKTSRGDNHVHFGSSKTDQKKTLKISRDIHLPNT